eukprot:3312594-Pyramimonas_sp.AAC.1
MLPLTTLMVTLPGTEEVLTMRSSTWNSNESVHDLEGFRGGPYTMWRGLEGPCAPGTGSMLPLTTLMVTLPGTEE